MLTKYADIYLDDVDASTPSELTLDDKATIARVSLPSTLDNLKTMTALGFTFADRIIKATISLSKCSLDLDKMMRLNIEENFETHKEHLLDIACASFTTDTRFNLKNNNDDADTVRVVLTSWFDDLSSVYVAMLKDTAIGFISLKELDSSSLYVHLAAVDEKYRLTGAGMSLYAKALLIAKERSYKKLVGRISSKNMAVLNLYSTLGAQFTEPKDVFLQEISHDL